MNINDDHSAGDLAQEFVGFAERILVGLHEDPALEIDDSILLSGLGRSFKYTDAGNARGVVGRTQDAAGARIGIAIGGIEVVHDFALVPDVVAGSEHVTAQIKEIFRDAGSQTEPSSGIFCIGNDEVDFMGVYEVGQMGVDNVASSAAEDVANEEDLHGAELLILTF